MSRSAPGLILATLLSALAVGLPAPQLAAQPIGSAVPLSVYLQSLVQYSDQTKNVSSNIRFGWLNTAGTGLFIVLDDLEHTGSFERTGFERGPVERTVVIKFTRQMNLMGF